MREINEIWKWKFGQPADFWIVNEKEIGKFIDTNKLKPVSHESLQSCGNIPETTAKMSSERAIDIDYIINISGGKRVPHLHFKGEIYLLNAEQWRTFSKGITEEFSKKLTKSNAINFEQFIELTDVMNSIT